MKKLLFILFISTSLCAQEMPVDYFEDESSQMCVDKQQVQEPTAKRTLKQLAPLPGTVEVCKQPQWKRCVVPTQPPVPGRKYTYWEPTLIIETVKSPGDYVIQNPLIDKHKGVNKRVRVYKKACLSLRKNTKGEDILPSATTAIQSLNGSTLQFYEGHVFNYLHNVVDALMCPSSPLVVSYYTEDHAVKWRTSKAAILGSNRLVRLGSWGNAYPLTGFVNHSSQLAASALVAIRVVVSAVSVINPDYLGNILLTKTDKLQLVYPFKGGCIKMGDRLDDYASDDPMQDGRYVWLYWHYKECPCIPTGV